MILAEVEIEHLPAGQKHGDVCVSRTVDSFEIVMFESVAGERLPHVVRFLSHGAIDGAIEADVCVGG